MLEDTAPAFSTQTGTTLTSVTAPTNQSASPISQPWPTLLYKRLNQAVELCFAAPSFGGVSPQHRSGDGAADGAAIANVFKVLRVWKISQRDLETTRAAGTEALVSTWLQHVRGWRLPIDAHDAEPFAPRHIALEPPEALARVVDLRLKRGKRRRKQLALCERRAQRARVDCIHQVL